MNLDLVEKIANAVLYEGYMLYPYRASAVKNRQRFNFGVLAPQSYSKAQRGTESYEMQTEVLLLGDEKTRLDVKVRFLHPMLREVKELIDSEFRVVPSLKVNEQMFQTWQEAVEREVDVSAMVGARGVSSLARSLKGDESFRADALNASETLALQPFSFPAAESHEPLQDTEGKKIGVIVRHQQAIEGEIELRIADCGLRNKELSRLLKITVNVRNTTPFENAERKSRDEALLKSLASAHTILSVHDGEFISLLEPPDEFSETVASCKNIGTFPVLVGENGERDCVLSSPIILYDYPQIAPESAGDLFDGAEIDEILTLRIMTMTDEEKREMRSVDEHARKILERTEMMSAEQLMKLHGTLRDAPSLSDEQR
jgi:hydrogenase maturation protease